MDRVIYQSECPEEAKLLAFFENRLPYFGRRSVERHLARCGDCCDSLAFLVKGLNSGTLLDEIHSFELDENALRAQTASVLSLIENTDRRERFSRTHSSGSKSRGLIFGLPYRTLAASAAVLVVAISVYIPLSNYYSPAAQAERAFNQTLKTNRSVEMQMPGTEYSERSQTRAVETSSLETFGYDAALSKISPNGEIPKDKSERLIMAKILIEKNTQKDSQQALDIIDGLLSEGPRTGELYVLRGMALYGLAATDGSKNEEAIAAFTSAIETSSPVIAAYFNRALVEGNLGRHEDAEKDLQKYKEKEKDQGWLNEAQSRVRR